MHDRRCSRRRIMHMQITDFSGSRHRNATLKRKCQTNTIRNRWGMGDQPGSHPQPLMRRGDGDNRWGQVSTHPQAARGWCHR